MSANAFVTAPGWYEYPGDAQNWHYWDGTAWTSHTRPRIATAVAAAQRAVEEAPEATYAEVIQLHAARGEQNVEATAPWLNGGLPQLPVVEPAPWNSTAQVTTVPPSLSAKLDELADDEPRAKRPSRIRQAHANGLGTSQTVGIWLLALSPVLSPLAGWGSYVGVQQLSEVFHLPAIVAPIVGAVAIVLSLWIFAAADAAQLRRNSYLAPSVAWMLLFPPLAYIVRRGKKVRRDEGLAWPAELTFFITAMAVIGSFLATQVPGLKAALPADLAALLPF